MKKYGDELFIYAMAMQQDKDDNPVEDAEQNDETANPGLSGQLLGTPCKAQKGVPPPANEWQMDHIIAKVYGGTGNGGANSYNNAQIWFRSHLPEQS
jgi:hypothetical protein